jgi:DNA-binding transcriptional regulator YiaG
MTEHIPTPLTARRVVTKAEELRRKREGTWDPATMVGETTPAGAAVRAAQQASPEKVADAQPIAIESLKPKFKAARKLTTEKPRETDAAGLVEIGGRRYVTAGRLASLLGVTVRTLSRWDAAGIGPPKIKVGKKVLYDLDKIPEWLASRET